MKNLVVLFLPVILFLSCSTRKMNTRDEFRQEIIKVEKDFETMVREKGLEEAFYFYAYSSAVIRRMNDSLIKGKDDIRRFYSGIQVKFELTWTPDFVGVSTDGSLAYTYGTYTRKAMDANGQPTESKGTFHTVWKRQPDGTWKYVWD